MKKRKIWGLGFYKESAKLAVYPISGRPPGRPVETENNLGFSRSTARSTDFGPKKISYSTLYRSTGSIDRAYARPSRSTGWSTGKSEK